MRFTTILGEQYAKTFPPISFKDIATIQQPPIVEEIITVSETTAEVQSEMDAYEERMALRTIDDGLTTGQRAVAALKRPERFKGEHEVARAWIRNYEPHIGILFLERVNE